MMKLKIFSSFLLLLINFTCYASNLDAFPGAEGYGRHSIGGRGGTVIHVTNLYGYGPGSLYQACRTKGPRIVVFDVAGVIDGNIEITDSNITIAGQTAPSPGITLEGSIIARPRNNERLHDIIIRFIRIRPPPTTGVGGDAVQLPMSERIILDHLSMSWATDETVDIIHSSEVTIQWSTFEEADPEGHAKGVPHNFAILSAYPDSGNVSIHHNLFANHSRRLPSLSPRETDKPAEFTNNIVYNFKEGLGHDGHEPLSGINIIGNYYKRGPSWDIITPFNFRRDFGYYLKDNYIEDYGLVINPQHAHSRQRWVKMVRNGTMADQLFGDDNIIRHSAHEAYQQVLIRAGAFPRDRVTKRTINELKTGSGSWRRNAEPAPTDKWFLAGIDVEPLQTDQDNDGMPDVWEKEHGLDFMDPSDNNRVMESGYSAIEEYINERAELVINSDHSH